MVDIAKLSGRLLATAKAIWVGGSPFNAVTAMWPTNDEGKYVIESEGIRLAFTNYGAALTNLWVNDTDGQEIDIVLGLDHADMYLNSKLNPYLNGMIGKPATQLFESGKPQLDTSEFQADITAT
jgi:aldose 1-epimerase